MVLKMTDLMQESAKGIDMLDSIFPWSDFGCAKTKHKTTTANNLAQNAEASVKEHFTALLVRFMFAKLLPYCDFQL